MNIIVIPKTVITKPTKYFRQKRVKINFSDIVTEDHILSLSRRDINNIKLKNYNVDDIDMKEEDEEMFEDAEPEPSKYDGNYLMNSVCPLLRPRKL